MCSECLERTAHDEEQRLEPVPRGRNYFSKSKSGYDRTAHDEEQRLEPVPRGRGRGRVGRKGRSEAADDLGVEE